MSKEFNTAPCKAILAERLWGMVLVITFRLLSKTALLYIMENFILTSVLRRKRLFWMPEESTIIIALDSYTIPCIIDLMKQHERSKRVDEGQKNFHHAYT